MYAVRIVVVVLAALMALSAAAAQAQDDSSFCVAVWYPSSEHPAGYDSVMNHLDVIDVIHPFWYTPMADGRLLPTNQAEDEAKLTAWREAGLQIIPSIFSGVSQMITDPDLRAVHVEQIVEVVLRMGYDGIDIDYEGFGLHTREPFSEFVELLADALHAQGKLLYVTVHPKTNDDGAWEGAAAQDWARISAAADVVNIMTYDYTSRNEPPGPIAPHAWVVEVLGYAGTIDDIARFRVGLPFYGYGWTRGRPPASAIPYEAVMRAVETFGLETTRDPASGEIVADLKQRGLPARVVYVEDAVSIEERLTRALDAAPTLGGAAVWGLGGEDPAVWDVLRAARPAPCSLPAR
jgi:spore germination protein YaaH